MSKESRESKKEQKLAQFFEERRGDMSLWSDKPTRAIVRRGGSIVFSLRFTPSELEMLRRKAEAEGVTVSELIRRSVLESTERPAGNLRFMIASPDIVAVGTPTVPFAERLIRLTSGPQGVTLEPETANV